MAGNEHAGQGMRMLYGLASDPGQLSRQLQQVQQNVAEATRKARENPMNDGIRVEKVVLNGTPGGASASVEITHKLGRPPSSFFVVNHRGGTAAHLKRLTMNAKRIVVTTTASATVDLWVY